MFEVPRDHTQGNALNYCKTCRRHLNGALSCPGCGATGVELSSVQDARSTLTMPRVDDDGAEGQPDEPQPAPASELEYEPDEPLADVPPISEAELRSARRAQASRAKSRSVSRGGEKGVESAGEEADEAGEPAAVTAVPEDEPPAPVSHARDAAAAPAPASHARSEAPVPAAAHARDGGSGPDDEESADSLGADGEHRGRRAGRRRGVGIMVTSGFAGIAVVGFLIFGSSGGTGAAGPAGSTSSSTTSTTSPSADEISVPAAPATSAGSASFSTSAGPSSSATATSASPSSSASTSHSASDTPTGATSSSTTTTKAHPSPTHTHTSKPSSSPTSCFLIFCN